MNSKRRPHDLARLRQRRAEGASYRTIGLELGRSAETIRQWALEDERRRARGVVPAAAVVVVPGALTPAEDVAHRAALVEALIARITPRVEAGTYPPVAYVTLCKYATEARELARGLAPKEALDPEDDPETIEAAAIFNMRIEQLIVRASQEEP